MKRSRTVVLTISMILALVLVAGGLAAKVGGDASRQVRLFAEVLQKVVENYVDPVETETLVRAAYEGMLGRLDANGAFLTPEELVAWKSAPAGGAGPGIHVLKAGSTIQIVAVDPESPADRAGIRLGDLVRTVDGEPLRDLSLDQVWRRIEGPAGTLVRLGLIHVSDEFQQEDVEVQRIVAARPAFDLGVERGVAVLRLRGPARVDVAALEKELEEVRSRGIGMLLVDLRNTVDLAPRDAARLAAPFVGGTLLRLRDKAGRVIEVLEGTPPAKSWDGPVAVLVNGATAGSPEGLAALLKEIRGATVLGETSYGLGAEPRLYELGDGAGVILSAARWETPDGTSWVQGIQPDETLQGEGEDVKTALDDQFRRALDWCEARAKRDAVPKAA